ncbi:MAG: NAD(P)H-binding protein [Candidatus Latescibacteria bacterium]|jgi:nucleoside-diphosphate-sugar epimerase|nr:NAD(P)H-binding protein [Candidatus Latescibacterota bacterium]MBT4139300.1 NAD(P)H-binding protein [Candidatus Latescibacterota bacterium]MBT5832310.1 NAD(P)H-binding protein [Candidatus Latescibacterota bacterium]
MIFVTGGTGYTGRWVVAELLKRQRRVKCLVRKTSDVDDLDHEDVSLVRSNLEAVDNWEGELAGCDAVISVAHIKYAPFVIDACKKHGVSRVVFFSSTWRFSKVKTPVVASLIQAEEAIKASGLDYTLLRPTMIYGPGDDHNISRLREFIKRRPIMPVFGSGEQHVQPVFVSDVARAAVDAVFCNEAIVQAFELAGADALTYNDMLNTLSESMGRFLLKVHVPISVGLVLAILGNRLFSRFPIQEDQVRRMKEDRAFDISEAKKILEFEPLTFHAGLQASTQLTGVPGL